jgi:hypothetical protein
VKEKTTTLFITITCLIQTMSKEDSLKNLPGQNQKKSASSRQDKDEAKAAKTDNAAPSQARGATERVLETKQRWNRRERKAASGEADGKPGAIPVEGPGGGFPEDVDGQMDDDLCLAEFLTLLVLVLVSGSQSSSWYPVSVSLKKRRHRKARWGGNWKLLWGTCALGGVEV